MLKLEYFDQADSDLKSEFFEKILNSSYEVLKKKIDGMLAFADGVIGLIIVDDHEMKTVNQSHRGKNESTDVVSLSYIDSDQHPDEFPTGFEMAGEIFISIDTAKKQAREYGHSLEKELEKLFVHGILHIFGFDHQNDKQEEEMEGWAERITELNSI